MMRKFIRSLTLAALALGATAMTAQAQGAKSFGVLAGVDFASITGDDFTDTGSLTGFIGGFYFGIPAGKSVVVEIDALYAGKGASDNTSSLDIRSGYIEVPVLVRYNFKPEGGIFLLAGPAVGFNISCNITDGTNSLTCSDFADFQPQTTFGGVLGIGFQKNRFGLEGRYDFDFGDAFQFSDGDPIAGKNSVIEVMARVMIK